MKTATYIKLDQEVKEKAQKLAVELGFGLSTIINAQLKQLVRDKRLVINALPQLSPFAIKAIAEAEKDLKNNKKWSKAVKSKKDLDNYFKNL